MLSDTPVSTTTADVHLHAKNSDGQGSAGLGMLMFINSLLLLTSLGHLPLLVKVYSIRLATQTLILINPDSDFPVEEEGEISKEEIGVPTKESDQHISEEQTLRARLSVPI